MNSEKDTSIINNDKLIMNKDKSIDKLLDSLVDKETKLMDKLSEKENKDKDKESNSISIRDKNRERGRDSILAPDKMTACLDLKVRLPLFLFFCFSVH